MTYSASAGIWPLVNESISILAQPGRDLPARVGDVSACEADLCRHAPPVAALAAIDHQVQVLLVLDQLAAVIVDAAETSTATCRRVVLLAAPATSRRATSVTRACVGVRGPKARGSQVRHAERTNARLTKSSPVIHRRRGTGEGSLQAGTLSLMKSISFSGLYLAYKMPSSVYLCRKSSEAT